MVRVFIWGCVLWVVAALLLAAQYAEATPRIRRNVTVFTVKGWRAASVATVAGAIDYSLQKMGEVGFIPRTLNTAELEDVCGPSLNPTDYFSNVEVFTCWKRFFEGVGMRGLVHVVLPPSFYGGNSWMWGLGDVCELSSPFGLTMGVATDARYGTEEDRRWPSAVIAAHELLHPIGAMSSSDPGAGLLWVGAGSLAIEYPYIDLPISQRSKLEVRKCWRVSRRERFRRGR